MRLTKRIAVCALTALLAVSMLTACGGNENGSGSGSSSTGGNTGSNSEANSGSNGETNTETKPGTGKDDTATDVSKLTSRAAKYFARQGVNGQKKYMRYTVGWDFDNKGNYSPDWLNGDWIEACDGRRKYCQNPVEDLENKKYIKAELYDCKEDTYYTWHVFDSGKSITKDSDAVTKIWVSNLSYLPEDFSTFSTTPVEPMRIDNVEYYCERDDELYTKYHQMLRYYCFEKTDVEGLKLKYIVNANSTVAIIKIDEVTSNFDPDLLRVPEGYKQYDVTYNESTNKYQQTYVGTTGKDSYPN